MSNRIQDYLPSHRNWLSILLGIVSLAGLYAISQYNFLLFHCLAEAFSIVIAIAVFAIFWNTRRFLGNGVYLVIGLGCLFAGVLDLIYVFAYSGMSVFPGADGNIALQAKTAAQWYVSLSCVGAFAFLRREINQTLAFFIYTLLLALTLGAIFYWRVFPDCFLEGVGITRFERLGLVVSCSAYLGALTLLVNNRREFDGHVCRLLATILIAFFVEDFASVVATEMNGFARTVAHLCQIVALYFVYKAFVEVGLTKPFDLLFRSQQQSAKTLERQQQFLTAVLDNAQCGIVACDADGVLTLLNRALREFHGRSLQRIPAEQWAEHYDLYHSDGKTRMTMEEVPLFRTLQGEHIHDVEMMVVPRGGPARTFVASGVPLRGKDDESHGAVAVMHDITERKQAEEALRQSEEGLRLVLEASDTGWWRLDLCSGKLTADQRCKALFGLPSTTEPSIALFLERVSPDDGAIARQQIAEAMVRPGDYQAEYRTVWPDGSLHWLLIKGRAFHDAPGKPRSLEGITMDVTARKQAEEEQLQRHRMELAHVARLSMMGEMAASLAHELGQPLHAVKNYARGSVRRVLKAPQKDEELVAALEQISEEANRAAEIVRRVKGFVEKREPQFSEVLVNHLVEEVVLLSKAEIEQRQAHVVLELSEHLPLVMGDPIQIEQVMMNLLRNGLEAMDETPQENRRLGIKTMRLGDEMVQVDVRDCGKGIDGEDLEKVFEAFFTTKPEGMGMGLAISRSIVRASGGRIWASTNQDRGCTFHFTLPVGKRS